MPSSACKTSARSEEHTSELQSHDNLVCRLLLEKKTLHLGSPLRAGLDTSPVPARRAHAPPSHNGFASRTSEHCAIDRELRSVFFFNDTATTEIYTLSLHDALPI